MHGLRFVGNVVLHTVAAIFGTMLLATPVSRLVRADTAGGVILSSWISSIVFGALIGALIAGYRKSETANWAWVIPGVIFVCRAGIYLGTWRTAFVSTFSGYECAIGLQHHNCEDFFVFSIPLIRGASYSAGAWLVMRFSHRSNETVGASSGENLPGIRNGTGAMDENAGNSSAL